MTQGSCFHHLLCSYKDLEMWFCRVGQPVLQFLTSNDSPTLASQLLGLQGHDLMNSISEDLQLDKRASGGC
ncbi:hypothetical protein AAY473_005419 [Plecturocebus cupreus]